MLTRIPHAVLDGFAGSALVDRLLDHVAEHEAQFEPTTVSHRGVQPSVRISVRLPGRSHVPPELEARLDAVLPELFSRLGVDRPDPGRTSMEVVAHRDGAFFQEHVDTFDDPGAHRGQRVLSCVYYFHRMPKAFSGGELRLFGLGGGEARSFTDVEPVRDRLVAFPSFLRHEVRRVVCPSGRFEDSRFAINCWIVKRMTT